MTFYTNFKAVFNNLKHFGYVFFLVKQYIRALELHGTCHPPEFLQVTYIRALELHCTPLVDHPSEFLQVTLTSNKSITGGPRVKIEVSK